MGNPFFKDDFTLKAIFIILFVANVMLANIKKYHFFLEKCILLIII